MEEGRLKADFYKMMSLLEGYLSTLPTEERYEIELLFANISEEITKLQKELKTHEFILLFTKSWNLTPSEMTALLKTVKNNNKGPVNQ